MNKGQAAAFSRAGALAVIAGGAALFLALIWLIGAGSEIGGGGQNGRAHAAANGLNGYAGLFQLLDNEGFDVIRSRNPAGLDTPGLLVLTPPEFADPEALAALLERRAAIGPTLVLLSKWHTTAPPRDLPPAARARLKRGWVLLDGAGPLEWTADLPEPYTLRQTRADAPDGDPPGWSGLGLSGRMPTRAVLFAPTTPMLQPLITDASDRALAVEVRGRPVIFVIDPDLMNNFGLADPARAAAALALVERLTDASDTDEITFDLTQNGFGGQENLLTLAFRPPFLAATLCLLAALLIIGWRAFQRFGPPIVSSGPDIAFGKQQLITNGAGLILRARRFALLASPYAALSARRIAERLGLARTEPSAIDAALARRLPGEEPFTRRAARLAAARSPADILTAARALDDLAAKLAKDK